MDGQETERLTAKGGRQQAAESLRLAEEGMPALTGTVVSAFFLGDRQRLIVGGAAPEPLITGALIPLSD